MGTGRHLNHLLSWRRQAVRECLLSRTATFTESCCVTNPLPSSFFGPCDIPRIHPDNADDALYRTRISGKNDGWVAQPSRFIVVYEPPAHREHLAIGRFTAYWHRAHPPKTINSDRDEGAGSRCVSPILFADGHAEIVDFTGDVFSGNNTERWLWYQPE